MTEKMVGRKPPEAYLYPDINQVPPERRTVRGGRVRLDQINAIEKRANELGFWKTNENGDDYFIPDYGRARDELERDYELIGGTWTPKAKA